MVFSLPIQEVVLSSDGITPFSCFSCGINIAEYPDVRPAAKVNRIEADAANVCKI